MILPETQLGTDISNVFGIGTLVSPSFRTGPVTYLSHICDTIAKNHKSVPHKKNYIYTFVHYYIM